MGRKPDVVFFVVHDGVTSISVHDEYADALRDAEYAASMQGCTYSIIRVVKSRVVKVVRPKGDEHGEYVKPRPPG